MKLRWKCNVFPGHCLVYFVWLVFSLNYFFTYTTAASSQVKRKRVVSRPQMRPRNYPCFIVVVVVLLYACDSFCSSHIPECAYIAVLYIIANKADIWSTFLNIIVTFFMYMCCKRFVCKICCCWRQKNAQCWRSFTSGNAGRKMFYSEVSELIFTLVPVTWYRNFSPMQSMCV